MHAHSHNADCPMASSLLFEGTVSATSEFISSAPATTHTSTPSSTSASPVAPVAAVTETETASTTPESPSVASVSLWLSPRSG